MPGGQRWFPPMRLVSLITVSVASVLMVTILTSMDYLMKHLMLISKLFLIIALLINLTIFPPLSAISRIPFMAKRRNDLIVYLTNRFKVGSISSIYSSSHSQNLNLHHFRPGVSSAVNLTI